MNIFNKGRTISSILQVQSKIALLTAKHFDEGNFRKTLSNFCLCANMQEDRRKAL